MKPSAEPWSRCRFVPFASSIPPRAFSASATRLILPERRWKLTSFHGPEKLRGEWWLGGFEREYFHVDTEEGDTLWVFTAGSPRALWLHGVFD